MQSRERIERVKKRAHEYERDYSGYAQSVLGAFQEEFRIGDKDSFKAASRPRIIDRSILDDTKQTNV
jgi:hypothetical protein